MGDGPESARLQSHYGTNPRIEWLGRVSDDERAARLAGADVLAAPSLGGESFGVVLLEAMATGTAVVASDLPGYRLAASGAARFTVPGDSVALAAAIREVLLDDARAHGPPGQRARQGCRVRHGRSGRSLSRDLLPAHPHIRLKVASDSATSDQGQSAQAARRRRRGRKSTQVR